MLTAVNAMASRLLSKSVTASSTGGELALGSTVLTLDQRASSAEQIGHRRIQPIPNEAADFRDKALAVLFSASLQGLPYCGAAPIPAALFERWNLDPILIGVLVAIAGLYAVSWGRVASRDGVSASAPYAFYAGWAACGLALISPLCALSVSLFSARVVQHMALAAVAAPLLALGRPLMVLGVTKPSGLMSPWMAAAAFALVLWFWHAPGPYAATFRGPWIYWTMHLTVLGAAIWLWSAVLAGADDVVGVFGAVLVTTGQMGLLGAVITFAGRPLYAPHQLTTLAWGLSPLEDQQLGGVLMWVPAGVILAAGFALAFISLMKRADHRALSRALG